MFITRITISNTNVACTTVSKVQNSPPLTTGNTGINSRGKIPALRTSNSCGFAAERERWETDHHQRDKEKKIVISKEKHSKVTLVIRSRPGLESIQITLKRCWQPPCVERLVQQFAYQIKRNDWFNVNAYQQKGSRCIFNLEWKSKADSSEICSEFSSS